MDESPEPRLLEWRYNTGIWWGVISVPGLKRWPGYPERDTLSSLNSLRYRFRLEVVSLHDCDNLTWQLLDQWTGERQIYFTREKAQADAMSIAMEDDARWRLEKEERPMVGTQGPPGGRWRHG